MSKRNSPVTVDLDRTREQLNRLGLGHAAEQVDALISDAVRDSAPRTR